MSVNYLLPPSTRAVGTGNPPLDMDAVLDALAAMGAGLNVLNAEFAGGADPSGATDSTAAFQAALSAALPGQCAYAPAGTYLISSPLIIPPYVGLRGARNTSSISQAGLGTVLLAAPGFGAAGNPVAAVILVLDQVTGGFATTSEEEHVSDLMIQGSSLSGSSNVIGIALYSGNSAQISRVSLQNILINGMTGWGYSDAGPQAEVHVRGFNVNIRGCGTSHANSAGGFNVHASDSEWLYCGSYSNYGDAWNILNSWDSAFGQCHAEHSQNGYSWHFMATYNNSSVDAGAICFSNCTIDAGELHGWFLESTSTALPPVTITGGYVRRCGTSGTFAGVCIDAYFGPVSITNMQVYPGQPDGGGSNFPAYALQLSGNGPRTSVTISGGVWIGTSAFLNCDGSQGLLTVSGDTTFGSGIAGSEVRYVPGVTLQAAASSELLPVDRVLITQPAPAVASSHDRSDVTGNFSPTTAIPYWRLVTLYAGVPVTSIVTWVTGTAKTGGSHGWVAISSVATGLIVAKSADQTDASTTWGSTNIAAPIALTSPYTPPVTGAYWLGFCITATGMPAVGSVTDNPDAGLAGAPPVLCGASAAHSSPPSVGDAIVPASGVAGDDFYIFAV